MMMMGGMTLMFFWMGFGTLLFLVLIGAVIWLLVSVSHAQNRYGGSPWQQMNTPSRQQFGLPGYSQGYPGTVPGPEISEEGRRTSSYAEQHSVVEYPQEIHQEQRSRL